MRVARMAETTLKMSSLQEAHGSVNLLDTTEILRTSAEANRSFIEKRGNNFSVCIEENLPCIMGKADEVIQVMLNVLTNANNHTLNGEIAVAAKISAEFVAVSVADNGAGIPAALLPRIFDRGVSNSGGTGFGLAICKSTIESHGGTIEIKSQEGKGTTVIFALPVHSEGDVNV
jgi:signal transduction histidine kinase